MLQRAKTVLFVLWLLVGTSLRAAPLPPITTDAFAELERKAGSGDQAAQLELGQRYVTGNGTRTNALKGFKWLRPLAEREVVAQRYVGEMLMSGHGTRQDVAEGMRWLSKAAEAANGEAQLLLAEAYYHGPRIPQDLALATKWYARAADSGQPIAQVMLGTLLAEGKVMPKDSQKARGLWEQAAAQDDTTALYNLGGLYFRNDLGPPDPAQAFKRWLRAAELGHTESQFNVGEMYRTGTGTAENMGAAIKWFQKAAVGRHAEAEYLLGKLYATGNGVAQNFQTTLKYFEAAAKDGQREAQHDFGHILLKGMNDVPVDLRRGYLWIQCAASQGHAHAMNSLGTMYQEGIAVPVDRVEGLKWFYLAEQQDNHEGAVNRRAAEAFLDAPEVAEARRRRDLFKIYSGRKVTVDDSEPTTVRLFHWFRIPVKIAGKTNYLVADTAAGITMLHTRHKARFGEPEGRVQVQALMPTPYELEIYPGQEMVVGKRSFIPAWVGFEDFTRFKTRSGMEFDGAFGLNCMEDHVVTFDGTANTFSIGGPVPEAALRTGQALPFAESEGMVTLDATLAGDLPVRLMLDSGNVDYLYLNTADWRKAFPQEPKHSWTNEAWGGGGQSVAVRAARLAYLKIGTDVYTNVVVSTGASTNSSLGQEFLRRQITTLDFPNRILYLRPSVHFGKPIVVNTSGLGLLRNAKRALIFSVARDSAAYRAGIRDKDEILAVNGGKIDQLEPWEISQLLHMQAGQEVTVEIRRNGKTRKATFRLRTEEEGGFD